MKTRYEIRINDKGEEALFFGDHEVGNSLTRIRNELNSLQRSHEHVEHVLSDLLATLLEDGGQRQSETDIETAAEEAAQKFHGLITAVHHPAPSNKNTINEETCSLCGHHPTEPCGESGCPYNARA